MPEQELQKTPFYDLHLETGGKMVGFSGYSLPISYPAGILKEHMHTREAASLFDVSHMGQIIIKGSEAQGDLEKLVTADLKALIPGMMVYSFLINDRGGIIDDLIISCEAEDVFFVVVNASRKEVDQAWIKKHLSPSVTMTCLDGYGLLALQGPKSALVLRAFSSQAVSLPFMGSCYDDIDGIRCHIARSGYTGEDGFEISCQADKAIALAGLLTKHKDVAWAGLGARDTLRVEAGLRLYGDDIDEMTTPVEGGLVWAVAKSRRQSGDFKGAEPILAQIQNRSATKKFCGFLPEGRMLIRKGTEIFSEDGKKIGIVTSGGFSPVIGGPVAMGYVETAFNIVGSTLVLKPRGREVNAKIIKLPFVPHNYVRL